MPIVLVLSLRAPSSPPHTHTPISMSSSSFLPLSLTPTFSLNRPQIPLSSSTLLKPSSSSPLLTFRFLVCHCSSSDREHEHWIREEQRWLREEQRWLREEQRWDRERDFLLGQISDLRLQIQALERRILTQDLSPSSSQSPSSVSDVIANVTALLQDLKEKNTNLVLESGSSLRKLVLEEKEEEEEEGEEEKEVIENAKEVVVKEAARVLDGKRADRTEKRNVLRKGSEGQEVREMQEALLQLGFYSGEEDMEYFSFSSGTERAVKTWQAALGAPEDGIMTAELLERLYLDISINDSGNVDVRKNSAAVKPKKGENGAAAASMTEISEVQQTVVEKGDTGLEVSHQRVFLLGENRWEEPSRLVSSERVDRSKSKDATTKCLQCRGEGRLLCTECDGTGEPNIEPQFLEWVDEGTKCPYCEGLGYTLCDLCGGKAMV